MILKNRLKKISLAVLFFMLFNIIPFHGISAAFAAVDIGDSSTVTEVSFVRVHTGKIITEGTISVSGTGLASSNILLKNSSNGRFEQIPDDMKTASDDFYLEYQLSAELTQNFDNEIRVGSKKFDLQTTTFPTITDYSTGNVNIDATLPAESIIMNVDNIAKLKSGVVKAYYGKGENNPIDPATQIDDTTGKITLASIPVIRPKGLQQVKFEGTEAATVGIETYTLNRSYIYNDAFRLIGNLDAGTITMSPNTGSKDSLVTLTAPTLNDAKKYKAFFLKNLTGDDDYSASNAAETVSLTLNVDGPSDRLIIKVPNDPTFELRSYNVVLTEVIGEGATEEIIATQVVGPGTPIVPDTFTVIGGDYIATLNTVNPSKGSDRGTEVQLIGNNLIKVNVPDLVFPSDAAQAIDTESSAKKLKVSYTKTTTDIMYGNVSPVAVTVVRYVSGQIGLPITFIQKNGNYFVQDVEDKINIKTGVITDTEDDPTRDIVLTIETVITEVADTTKIYRIEQVINVKDGFEFEPYSLTPVIDEVVPEQVQVLPNIVPDYTLKETVLISITGEKFLVDRYETGGEYKTNYPTVLIKVQETLVDTEYDIKISPNEEVIIGADTIRGTVRAPLNTVAATGDLVMVLVDGASVPATPKVIVLDDDGNVMDGSDGKSVGTRMLVEIPQEAISDKKGVKNIHIINPQRDSIENGKEAIKVALIEFVETDNFPVIEAVVPKVVTVDGGEEIVITGTNIEEGVKLYLDGVELTGFTRDIDPTGKKILVKFTVPPGREGTTQVQLFNTSGGMAVSDFTYVKSFNKDPELVSIAPTKGAVGTLVLANGDNYLRPDPTVPDTEGVNGYRLIGTRAYLDGEDVNSYTLDSKKNIAFVPYDVPDPVSFLEFRVVDDATGIKEMLLTPYWQNIEVTETVGATEVVWWIDFDEDKNTIISDRKGTFYSFRYDATADKVNAFDKDGLQLTTFVYDNTLTDDGDGDPATQNHIITVGGKTFTLHMNNNIFALKNDPENKPFIDLVNYGESVVFKRIGGSSDYFVAYKDYDGSIALSNGNDKIYTIEYDAGNTPKYRAKKSSTDGLHYFSAIDSRGFTLTDGEAIVLEIYSPYEVTDNAYVSTHTAKEITGHLSKVISKTQMKFIVPLLESGKGLKDVAVVNPDTKSAKLEDGFDYVSQTSTHPTITSIGPNDGAVDGGYVINITGKGFEDDMKVYIDSVLVPAIDTVVALDGKSVTVRVPECIKDLSVEFNVDRLEVPVVVINNDGGSDYAETGFEYVIPTSSPEIKSILPATGSTIGGAIVEVLGYEFRYFEPYTNKVGGTEYNLGDPFTDLNNNGKWDDLVELDKTNLVPKVGFPVPAPNPYFSEYYDSPIMPKVYLNEKEAKIVEFAKGYIKIITPVHTDGQKDLYVVNNDSGISNKVVFDYTSSNPTVTSVVPAHGRKLGSESRDIYGTKFASSKVKGYVRDDAATIVELADIQMPVQFGELSNREIAREAPNSGRINAGKSTVTLDGGLIANYNLNGAGGLPQVEIIINESNKIYRRTFTNYDNGPIFIPAGMLQVGADFYRPNGFDETELTNVLPKDQIFEYIKVEVDDKRFLVDRGFAQKVTFDNDTHVTVTTPSYYTIDPVKLRLFNPDGGHAESSYTFNNPASLPKIYNVEPKALDATGLEYFVQATINGGIEMEVKGVDLREGAKVYIGDKLATHVDHTTSTETIDGVIVDLDVLIVKVPAGATSDIDIKVPILVENTDMAVANSAQLSDLYGTINTKPYYFVYRKPLSDPVIESVKPEETSRHGGNTITFYGTDFRDDATVIIGSKGGVPVKDTTMSERGKKLVFVTPGNLTVGDKDIQVINTDFGTGTKSSGLKVVSDPIQTKITKEDGVTGLEWVSVEGGDKFKIIGTGFMSGAVVVIGGERTLKEDAKTVGETGLYIHDEYITVAGGTPATSVEYIDENTLLVTSPEIQEEDTFIVTVFNSDGGITDSNLDIEYKEPVPSTPLGLLAELINNQYVKIYGYTSENFDYFEIYYYIGPKHDTHLIQEGYKEFIFVDTTEIEPYRITDIPGVADMRETDSLYISLRAFNKFGGSNWSNIVGFTQEELKDVERIGETDSDGGLEVPEWLDYQTVNDTTSISTHLKHKDLPNEIVLDYTTDQYKGLYEREITLPSEIVKESLTLVIANYGDSKLQFLPINLNTNEFREMNYYEKSYGRVSNEILDNASASAMKLMIPRGYKAVSPLIRLGFNVQNNTEYKAISKLNGMMDMALYYGNIKLSSNQLDSLKIYKFNTDSNVWLPVSGTIDKTNQTVYTKIDQAGSYMLITTKF